MTDWNDPEQQRLRDAFEARQREIEEAAARIYEGRGDELARQVAIRDQDVIADSEFHEEAARDAAQLLAEHGVRSTNFALSDHRDVIDEAMRRVEERHVAQEELSQESSQPVAEAQAHARPLEEELQALAASFDRRHGQANYDGLSQAEIQQPESVPQEVASWDAWEARVRESEWKQMQVGRSDEAAPVDLTQPLSPNEILQRFDNPDFQARYQYQDDQRRDYEKSSSLSPEEIAQALSAHGGSADTTKEIGLLADFVTSQTKEKAAEEELSQAFGAARGEVFGRGGVGGRGR